MQGGDSEEKGGNGGRSAVGDGVEYGGMGSVSQVERLGAAA